MAAEIRRFYRLGEHRLDPNTRTLRRDEAAIHLPGIPFQVLLYLIENRDRLVGREELLDRFWNGRDVYEASLTKAVGAIRKALDDSKEQPLFIETRYGEGYRYIGPCEEVDSTEEAAAERESPLPARSRRILRPVGIALGLILLLSAIQLAWHRRTGPGPGAAPPPRSIAILPLKDLSNLPGEDYFVDGVTESLITELAKMRELKVIARTSSFAFKGKETDTREIGRRLGVVTLLEGSLRRDEGGIRIAVRLINAEDGRVLWTGDFARPLKDIAVVQDEIGCSVAETLKTVLCRDLPHKAGPSGLASYDTYLKARDWRLKGDALKAAEFYRQAVALDSNYALAWAGLAEAYSVMEMNSLTPPRESLPRAREAAHKAIALDPSLASPYASLGSLAAFSDRHWETGERFLRQAIEMNPNYAVAHAWFGGILLAQGKFDEAEKEYARACALDPLHPGFVNNLAETYIYWRKPERGLEMAAKSLEIQPGNQWALFNQAKGYYWLGRYDEAQRVVQGTQYEKSMQYFTLVRTGRAADARQLLPQLLRKWGRNNPYFIAAHYAGADDREAAFAWLRKAADQEQADLVSLKIDPAFDGLRNDPRFADLLWRVRLAP
ncbi:MAG: winged helix-turn-helix domain-containing tetratricopeptide repeat protein [Blastocatellia bacterium]